MDAMHKRRSRSEPQLYAELLRALANHHEKSAFVHVMKQMLAAGARPNSLVMDVVRDYTALREHQGPDSPSAGQEPHDEDNDDAGADDHYGDDDEPRSF
ncbi:hypothetical protein H4R19_006826 [Coemansia spiralis]|nr:hypothetical protein H4R19_006826 [Coemansia spiralis]